MIQEILLEGVQSTVCSVPRWLYYFLMEGLDDLLVVNFNDPTAARGVGAEGQHGKKTVILALAVGS